MKSKNNLKYVTVKSGLESVEGAYLGQFVSNGTKTLDDVTPAMCQGRSAVDEPEAKLAVRALAAEIAEQVGVNHYRVNAGDISFEPAMAGSLPSMDAAPTEENALYVNIVASEALGKEIGAIVPTRDKADAIQVMIDNVEDVTTHQRMIIGTQTFMMTGSNISARQEGEGMTLLTEDGTIASTVTVTAEDGMGQRIKAALATSVSSGTYLLQLTTHGYATPDADAESYTKKVQVVYVAPAPVPTIAKVTSVAGENAVRIGAAATVEGVCLGDVRLVDFTYVTTGGGSQTVAASCTLEGTTKALVAEVPGAEDIDLTKPAVVGVLDEDGNTLATRGGIAVQS